MAGNVGVAGTDEGMLFGVVGSWVSGPPNGRRAGLARDRSGRRGLGFADSCMASVGECGG